MYVYGILRVSKLVRHRRLLNEEYRISTFFKHLQMVAIFNLGMKYAGVSQ